MKDFFPTSPTGAKKFNCTPEILPKPKPKEKLTKEQYYKSYKETFFKKEDNSKWLQKKNLDINKRMEVLSTEIKKQYNELCKDYPYFPFLREDLLSRCLEINSTESLPDPDQKKEETNEAYNEIFCNSAEIGEEIPPFYLQKSELKAALESIDISPSILQNSLNTHNKICDAIQTPFIHDAIRNKVSQNNLEIFSIKPSRYIHNSIPEDLFQINPQFAYNLYQEIILNSSKLLIVNLVFSKKRGPG